MIGSSTRKLDLYDFFSILLPGMVFLIGVLPFFPNTWPISSPENGILLLIGGYVVGRALEPISVRITPSGYFQSHRVAFHQELNEPRSNSPATIKQFYNDCGSVFDIVDKSDWKPKDVPRVVSEDLYTLVRSYVHLDGRGRSRTFQALYSFYRSMLLVTFFWAFIYAYYAFAKILVGLPFRSHLPVTMIGSLGDDAGYAAIAAAGISLLGVAVFVRAQDRYQRYFIQYLISDFLVIENVDNPEGIVMADSIEKYMSPDSDRKTSCSRNSQREANQDQP